MILINAASRSSPNTLLCFPIICKALIEIALQPLSSISATNRSLAILSIQTKSQHMWNPIDPLQSPHKSNANILSSWILTKPLYIIWNLLSTSSSGHTLRYFWSNSQRATKSWYSRQRAKNMLTGSLTIWIHRRWSARDSTGMTQPWRRRPT